MTVADAPPPFWPRLRRALIVLTLAVAAHIWVVPSSKTNEQPSVVAAAGQSAVVPIASTLGRASDRIADSVRVLHTLSLARPLEHEWTRPLLPLAVGTAGLIAATHTLPIVDTPAPPASRLKAEATKGVLDRSTDSTPANEAAVPSIGFAPIAGPSTHSALQRLAERAIVLAPQARLLDAAADRRRRDEETVRRILREYTLAYERMDVEAARLLWPSVDVRALQRAFERLDAQQLRLGSCGVAFAGQSANARCQGDAVYRPKVGTRVLHLTGREWTFNLSRSHAGWQIVNAEIQ